MTAQPVATNVRVRDARIFASTFEAMNDTEPQYREGTLFDLLDDGHEEVALSQRHQAPGYSCAAFRVGVPLRRIAGALHARIGLTAA